MRPCSQRIIDGQPATDRSNELAHPTPRNPPSHPPTHLHAASFCVETADFRKVRFTYMDGGSCVQVFNSVWYPRFDTDAPILGVDLLLFGGHKMLAVVDYQPLSKEPEYQRRYLDHLAPIKAKYPALAETISNRYYEDTRWFSDHMLFGRLQDPAQIASTLMPAFQEYLGAYTGLVRESRAQRQQQQGREGQMDEAAVKARHRDYDEYNLIRDPAGKLFEAYFGKPFAAEMLGFLFELADPAVLAAHEAEQAALYGPGGSGPMPVRPAAAAGGGGGGAAAAAAAPQQQQ
jgi:15,16-dihydrobiliverdin:ferredoxin oxidoreductase